VTIHFLMGWLILAPLSPVTYQEPTPTVQTTSDSESGQVSQGNTSDALAQNAGKVGQNVPPSVPISPTDEPLTSRQKFSVFGRRMISPTGFAKSAFTASISKSPEEWGEGMEGFGKRYGNKIINRTVENGIGFLVAVPLHQDPRYVRSTESGFWRRIRHGLVYTVLTPTDDGGRTFATWRFAGNYGAQFISNSWRPERYRTVSDALRRGTVSIGYDAASNVFKAIWPDIKRTVFRH
jgi:hypothetical protein